MMKVAYFKSPIGILKITDIDNKLHELKFVKKEFTSQRSTLLNNTKKQLAEYFKGIRREFNIPLAIEGTTFQKKCWKELLKVPYGEVKTYKDIAVSIKKPKAYRAVGMANNRNKLPIIIPCHRIIAASSHNGGYAFGMRAKNFLLKLEQSYK